MPTGPDAEIIGRRDELLSPIAAKLNRTVKRTLGDDQNRMLDLLRSTPNIDAESLLGPEDAHLALFADAVQDQLAEAYAAGATFGGVSGGGLAQGRRGGPGGHGAGPDRGGDAAPTHCGRQ